MDYHTFHKKRNQIFISIFASYIILHLILTRFLYDAGDTSINPILTVVFLIALGIIFRKNSSSLVVQYALVIYINIYILVINIVYTEMGTMILFIFPMYIAFLYLSFIPKILFFLATSTEIVYLYYFHFSNMDYQFNFSDLVILLLLILFLGISSTMNTLFEKRYWIQINEQNSSMKKQLTSRGSYLDLFFENAKDGIAVFDLDNKVIEINPAFEDLYGWKREDIIGKSIHLVPPENREDAQKRRHKVLQGESYYLLETQDMKKDGTLFEVQITLSPIYDYNKRLIASSVISRDVSYKKEAEKHFLQSEKLKLAGEIAAGVAHEIRNPLTSISGFIQLMNNNPNQPYALYTQIIEKEIERINYIISEFLILSKPHVNIHKSYHLKKTLEDIHVLFQPELNLKGISLTKKWLLDDIELYGEENQIKQVLINIIKNSIESIEVHGKIDIICTSEDDQSICIMIADNGIGMSHATLDNIFEPFFTTKVNGTGLGMMISEKIITEHGGTIKIDSTIGKGTIVTIQLPYRLNP